MNSSPQAFGGNPLAATDISIGNEQKRSVVNPSIGDKSLNTKEFSDVLDGENAAEKVAGAGQADSAASDGLNTDQALTDSTLVVTRTRNLSKAASSGNGLPSVGMGLPRIESAESDGSQPPTSQSATAGSIAQNLDASGEIALATAAKEGNQNTFITSLQATQAEGPNSNLTAMGIENTQLPFEQLQQSSTAGLPEDPAPIISQPINSGIVQKAGRSSASSPMSLGVGGEGSTVASAGAVSERYLSANATQSLDASSVAAKVVAAPVNSAFNSVSDSAANVVQSNSLRLDGLKGQSISNGQLVSEADLLRQTSQSSQPVNILSATSVEESAVTKSLAKSDFAQVYRTASETSVQSTTTVDTTKQGWSDTVMQRVMWMSSQQINRAEIKLDPPELGALQVRVSTNQSDQTTVVFTSPNSSVRDALDQGLPRLREMMESQGVNLADVNVSDQNAEQRERQESLAHEGSEQLGRQDGHDTHQTVESDELMTTKSLNLVDHYV